MLREKSNNVYSDAAYTGYNYYQYTDKRNLIYKVPPFTTVKIKQGADFDRINQEFSQGEPRIGNLLSEVNVIKIVETKLSKLSYYYYMQFKTHT